MKNKSILHYAILCTLLSIVISPVVFAQEKVGEGYAFEQNARLGRGVNIIGYDPLWNDPSKARMKEKHFRRIKEAGFDNVRIKISPFKFSLKDAAYTIDPAFFITLDWAIQEALKNNLMVIVDFHEHTGLSYKTSCCVIN